MGLNLGVSDIIEIMKTIDSKKKCIGSKNFFSAYARRQKIINKKDMLKERLKNFIKLFNL